MASAPKSLKAQNIPWLGAAIVFDVLLLIALSTDAGVEVFSKANATRLGFSAFVPVAVMLLVNLLPTSMKERLVYWRTTDVLPGHRAFSLHAPADSRIDMKALEAALGSLPSDPKEQNTLWYRLYKAKGEEVSVMDSQKTYLFLRELAAISAVLVVPATAYLAVVRPSVALMGGGLFLLQTIAAAVGARNSGIRFVTNVLGLYSSNAPAAPKKTTRRRKGAGDVSGL